MRSENPCFWKNIYLSIYLPTYFFGRNMMMWSHQIQLGVIVICLIVSRCVGDESIIARVDKAIGIAKAQIASIHKKWNVDSYPNFLKSCFMHRSSWEILKYKYLDRMLDSIVSNSPKKFVASFSGRYFFYFVVFQIS